MPRTEPPPFRLLLITDHLPNLPERVARALLGAPEGQVALQLRMKHAPASEQLSMARELRRITRERGAFLLINDRVDVALLSDADGVHLPGAGLAPADARRLLGERWVGVSCHTERDLAHAARGGADYATLSPIHAVEGKAAPLGVDGFGRAVARRDLPCLALGGVSAADVASLLAAGAHGVALIRAVLHAEDPARVVSELLTRIASAASG